MSVILKEVTTRPSVNDMFYFEGYPRSSTNGVFDLLVDDSSLNSKNVDCAKDWPLTHVVSSVFENRITWQGILDRRNELRSDLKGTLTVEFLNNKITTAGDYQYCYFNPFSTTLISTATWNTWEDFVSDYRATYAYLSTESPLVISFTTTINRAKDYNNVISEVIIVDGTETPFPEDLPPMYQGKFIGA